MGAVRQARAARHRNDLSLADYLAYGGYQFRVVREQGVDPQAVVDDDGVTTHLQFTREDDLAVCRGVDGRARGGCHVHAAVVARGCGALWAVIAATGGEI